MNNFINNKSNNVDSYSLSTTNFLPRVFTYMAMALGISALTAYSFAHSPQLLHMLIRPETGGLNFFGYVAIFAPFILVMVMSMRFQRLSVGTMSLLYAAFSILMGISLSFIFLAYTEA